MPSTEIDKSAILYAVVQLHNPTEDHILQVTLGLRSHALEVPKERPHGGSLYVIGSAESFEKLIGEKLSLTTKTITERFQLNGEVRKVETEIVVAVSPQEISNIKNVDRTSQHIASIYFEPRLDTSRSEPS